MLISFVKDVELILLRHQLSMLTRQHQRPKLRPADRAVIAALTRLLPERRRRGLVVTLATLLAALASGAGDARSVWTGY